MSPLSESSRFESCGNRNAEVSASPPEPLTKNPPTTTLVSSDPDAASVLPTFKYVDRAYNEEEKRPEYNDTEESSRIPAEEVQPLGTDVYNINKYEDCCFILVRDTIAVGSKSSRFTLESWIVSQLDSTDEDGRIDSAFSFIINSMYLIKACRAAIGDDCAALLNLKSAPAMLRAPEVIPIFPSLEEHQQVLTNVQNRTDEEHRMLEALNLFLQCIRDNFRATLAQVKNFLSTGDITFDLFYAILIPGSIFIEHCATTGEPRALRLVSWKTIHESDKGQRYYNLTMEELVAPENVQESGRGGSQATGAYFRMVEATRMIHDFGFVERICDQKVFPLEYSVDPEGLKNSLIRRGRKWAEIHSHAFQHMQYSGVAKPRPESQTVWTPYGTRVVEQTQLQRNYKYTVQSRVIIDKEAYGINDSTDAKFRLLNYPTDGDSPLTDLLTDDEVLLAPPILYGFSFSERTWMRFNVNYVTSIDWNDEALHSLVLPLERKELLCSLIKSRVSETESGEGKASSRKTQFDDFVQGKGRGLVISLFGPPGVGKTLSAEAISNCFKRPLYTVGSGGLGADSDTIDQRLGDICALATRWNAVLLIDEADVFLEERSRENIKRNAIVATFLRHLEYYQGVIFLTTNRVSTFDRAFLSRFHVALHFQKLTKDTRLAIWQSFLQKADSDLPQEVVVALASRDLNGRQIKNACRTASSLALSRGEKVQLSHVQEALQSMEELVTEFTEEERLETWRGEFTLQRLSLLVGFLAVLLCTGLRLLRQI